MMMASLNLHLVNEARKVAIMVYPSPYGMHPKPSELD